MVTSWRIVYVLFLAVVLATTFPLSIVYASPGASVSFDFNQNNSTLALDIESNVAVDAVQVKVSLPPDLLLGDVLLSGFLDGAEHLLLGSEHRWFHLSAGGGTSGSIVIPLATISNRKSTVSLVGIDLKAASGERIKVDTPLPIILDIMPKPTPSSEPLATLRVYLTPPTQEIRRRQEFQFSLRVEQAKIAISGAGFILAFDPEVLQIIDIIPGKIFGENPLVGVKHIDNSRGEIQYAVNTSFGATTPSPKDTIAIIKGKVTAYAPISESTISLVNVSLVDEDYKKISGIIVEQRVVKIVISIKAPMIWQWVFLGIIIVAIASLAVVLRSPTRRHGFKTRYSALLRWLGHGREK